MKEKAKQKTEVGGAKSTQCKKKGKKNKSENHIYILCFIIQRQFKSRFDVFFVHFLYVTTNKSKLQKCLEE